MDYTDQKATMISLLDDLETSFFQQYRTAEEAWDAYNGICHSLIALLNVLEDGKEYFNDKKEYFEGLIEMYIEDDEEEDEEEDEEDEEERIARDNEWAAKNQWAAKYVFGGFEELKKEEIIVRPPEDGCYYRQKYQGVEYATLTTEDDDLIYLFDMVEKKPLGAYDPATKTIDVNVRVVFEE